MKKFVAMLLAIVMCVACMTACSSAPAANTGDGSSIIIGGVGPVKFYEKICGATVIEMEGSRGIYKDMLRARPLTPPENK